MHKEDIIIIKPCDHGYNCRLTVRVRTVHQYTPIVMVHRSCSRFMFLAIAKTMVKAFFSKRKVESEHTVLRQQKGW